MPDLKIGDVVKLKSGGPKMTITLLVSNPEEDESLDCCWFGKKDELHSNNFPKDAVELFVDELEEMGLGAL